MGRNLLGELRGPFDAAHPIGFDIVIECDIFKLERIFQAIQIEVIERQSALIIDAHHVERGRRDRFANAKSARKPLGEVRFPCTQIAFERDHRAGNNHLGKGSCYPLRPFNI